MERQAVNKLNRRLLTNHLAKKSDLAEEEKTPTQSVNKNAKKNN